MTIYYFYAISNNKFYFEENIEDKNIRDAFLIF